MEHSRNKFGTKLMEEYSPEDREAARIGFEKSLEFIRRFDAAGGILKEGSDASRGMAAIMMHEGLAMDVEAGVPPMRAIQAATINVARVYHKDEDYGSVEIGKVADLSIVGGNPLEDITVIGGTTAWFDADPEYKLIPTIHLVMKDGRIYRNEIDGYLSPEALTFPDTKFEGILRDYAPEG